MTHRYIHSVDFRRYQDMLIEAVGPDSDLITELDSIAIPILDNLVWTRHDIERILEDERVPEDQVSSLCDSIIEEVNFDDDADADYCFETVNDMIEDRVSRSLKSRETKSTTGTR